MSPTQRFGQRPCKTIHWMKGINMARKNLMLLFQLSNILLDCCLGFGYGTCDVLFCLESSALYIVGSVLKLTSKTCSTLLPDIRKSAKGTYNHNVTTPRQIFQLFISTEICHTHISWTFLVVMCSCERLFGQAVCPSMQTICVWVKVGIGLYLS